MCGVRVTNGIFLLLLLLFFLQTMSFGTLFIHCEFNNYNYFAYWNVQFTTLFLLSVIFHPLSTNRLSLFKLLKSRYLYANMDYYLNWYIVKTQNASLVTLIASLFIWLKYAYYLLPHCRNNTIYFQSCVIWTV